MQKRVKKLVQRFTSLAHIQLHSPGKPALRRRDKACRIRWLARRRWGYGDAPRISRERSDPRRNIGGGAVEAKENLAVGIRARHVADEFAGDISGVQFRKNQNVRHAGNFAFRQFARGNVWDQRGVHLQFAVEIRVDIFRLSFLAGESGAPPVLGRCWDAWRCLWSKTRAGRLADECPAIAGRVAPSRNSNFCQLLRWSVRE